jgi:hypothetical protein
LRVVLVLAILIPAIIVAAVLARQKMPVAAIPAELTAP